MLTPTGQGRQLWGGLGPKAKGSQAKCLKRAARWPQQPGGQSQGGGEVPIPSYLQALHIMNVKKNPGGTSSGKAKIGGGAQWRCDTEGEGSNILVTLLSREKVAAKNEHIK